jgi:hypothetical protein
MFKSKKGTEFVGIKNYTNKNGEISNQTLNVGVDVLKAKKKDLESLKGLSIEQLYTLADGVNVSHEIADKAIGELLVSGTKNVSTEIENRTAASQLQTDIYTHVNKGMKVLTESGVLYVAGFVVAKTVLVKGEYKTVNKQAKTLVKDAIKKALKFKMNEYRSFMFKNANQYKINGTELTVIK